MPGLFIPLPLTYVCHFFPCSDGIPFNAETFIKELDNHIKTQLKKDKENFIKKYKLLLPYIDRYQRSPIEEENKYQKELAEKLNTIRNECYGWKEGKELAKLVDRWRSRLSQPIEIELKTYNKPCASV